MSGNDGGSHYGDNSSRERRSRNDSPDLRRGSSSQGGYKDPSHNSHSNGKYQGGGYGGGDNREDGYSRRGGYGSSFRHDSRGPDSYSDSNDRYSGSSHSTQSYSSHRQDSRPHQSSGTHDRDYSSRDRYRGSSSQYDDYRERRSPSRSNNTYDDHQRPYKAPYNERSENHDASSRYAAPSGFRSSESSMDVDRRTSSSEYYPPGPSYSQIQSPSIRSSDSSVHPSSQIAPPSTSYRPQDELHKSLPTNGRTGTYDRELLSMSRASTQPLDGFGPSHAPLSSVSIQSAPSSSIHMHSTPTSTNGALPGSEKRGESLASFTRSLLQDLPSSSFSSEEYAALKQALESSAASLQTIRTMEAGIAKTRSRELQLSNQIDDAETSVEQLYVEYYTADYQLRVTEGDYEAVTRVVNSLDAANGEWPDPQWSFPPYQSFDEVLMSLDAPLESQDVFVPQNLPAHL